MSTAYRTRNTVRLQERVRSDYGLRVDEQNAVLRGVRILGLRSGNGREYCPRGLAAACGLYEGKPCYVNHPASAREVRRVEDKCGWLENIRQAGDGGLTGDLRLLKSHPMTPRVLEAARVRPELFMLSHNAVGRERHGSRGAIIEGIARVDSVDIVSEGATCSSLFEHRYRPPPAPASTSQVCAEVRERARQLGLLPLAEARPRRTPRQEDADEARRRRVRAGRGQAADDDDSDAARARLVHRLRNPHLPADFDPARDEAQRRELVESLRRAGRPGGGVRSLQEQRDDRALTEAVIRHLRSIR